MGTFNAVCHLSGITISESEPVIMVPVCYQEVLNTTTQVYSSSACSHIASYPIYGRYNGYRSIDNIENEKVLDLFRETINNGLINNDYFNVMRFFFGNRFAIFKRDSFPEQFADLSFLTNIDILQKYNHRNNLHPIQSLDNNLDFINILSNNHIASIGGNTVYRYGHILIKKSFFNAMVENNYISLYKNVFNNIYSFITEISENDLILEEKKIFFNDTENKSYFENKILKLFNDRHTFSHDQFRQIIALKYQYLIDKSIDETFIKSISESIVTQAIIAHIYTNIGKTFYPNAAYHRDMKPLYDFAKTLLDELEKTNEE